MVGMVGQIKSPKLVEQTLELVGQTDKSSYTVKICLGLLMCST